MATFPITADVTATAVPLQGGALGETRGTVAIDGPEFETLVARADLPIDAVEFAEPDVTVGGSIAILGASIGGAASYCDATCGPGSNRPPRRQERHPMN